MKTRSYQHARRRPAGRPETPAMQPIAGSHQVVRSVTAPRYGGRRQSAPRDSQQPRPAKPHSAPAPSPPGRGGTRRRQDRLAGRPLPGPVGLDTVAVRPCRPLRWPLGRPRRSLAHPVRRPQDARLLPGGLGRAPARPDAGRRPRRDHRRPHRRHRLLPAGPARCRAAICRCYPEAPLAPRCWRSSATTSAVRDGAPRRSACRSSQKT